MRKEHPQTLTDIKDLYCKNYDWLAAHAKIPKENRFLTIKEKIAELALHYDASTHQVTKDMDRNELLLTAYEARKFNRIIDFFKNIDQSQLPIRGMKSMCKGPTFHIDEKPELHNSEGRDIQFEFLLSSFLSNAGLKVIRFDDIQIDYATTKIRYECKRPIYRKNLRPRFSEAVDQLAGKIAPFPNEYGIVAFSIERIDEFDRKLYQGADIEATIHNLVPIKDAVIEELKDSLALPPEKKIIGLHICINTVLWNKKAGQFNPIEVHFTEKARMKQQNELYDFLFDSIKGMIEKAN